MPASGKCAFQAGNGGRLGSHALRHLCLGEASLLPRVEERIKQGRFFALDALDALDFGTHTGTPHQLLDDLIMSSHA